MTLKKTKGVDLAALSNELSSSELSKNPPDTFSVLVDRYNVALSSALDGHAPLVTRTFPSRPLVPMFNDDIKVTSRQRRKAERRWRRTALAADLRAFKDLRNQSNNLLNVARNVFYKDLIDESSGERKKLFSVTKRLLGVERDTQYPPIKDKVVLNKIIRLVIFSLRRLWSYKTSLMIICLRQCRLAKRSV